MLEVAIQQLQLRDQPFGDLIASPLPPATRAALDELFKRPEVRHVAKKLKLKTSDWVAIKHRMVELIASHDGRKAGLEWQELIDLATSGLNGWCKDPLAASIGALYAVAIWEGAAVDPESKVLDPGWRDLILPLIKSLVKANANQGADYLAKHGVEVIQGDPHYRSDSETMALLGEFRELRSQIETRYNAALIDLAWAVREALKSDSIRPGYASLAWTLGDVHLSNLVRETSYLPSAGMVAGLLDQAIWRLPLDPLVLGPFLNLDVKAGAGVDLQEHPLILYRVRRSLSQESDGLASQVFGHCLLDYLAKREVRFANELAQVLEVFKAGLTDHSSPFARLVNTIPSTLIRLLSLMYLIRPEDDPVEVWEAICGLATQFLRTEREADVPHRHDLALDIPFSYLPTSGGRAARNADLIELHRAAGLSYTLAVSRPRASVGHGSEAEFGDELDILLELRGDHFGTLLEDLPFMFRRYMYGNMDDAPLSRWLSKKTVYGHILESWQKLTTLHDRLDAIDPSYTRWRRDPHVPMSQLPTYLGSTGVLGEVPRQGSLKKPIGGFIDNVAAGLFDPTKSS